MSETPPVDESVPPADGPEHEPSLDSQEDFVHESVELPEWISVAFGLILVGIAALAIVTA